MKVIQGKVVYKDVGPGCWGIVDSSGNEWRTVNLPEQLKKEGAHVRISAREIREEASIFMWGKPVKVTGFHTLGE